MRDGHVEEVRKIARLVLRAGRIGERHRLFRDRVPAPDLDAVQAELRGRFVDQAHERQLGVDHQRAPVGFGHELLAPRALPLDRALQRARGPHQDHAVHVGIRSGAEAAVDILSVNPHLRRVEAHYLAQAGPHHGRPLVGYIQVEALAVARHHAGARLRRAGCHAPAFQAQAHHVTGACEGFCGRRLVAIFEVEHEVARHGVLDQRRTGSDGILGVRDHRQVIVVHGHQSRSVLGLILRIGKQGLAKAPVRKLVIVSVGSNPRGDPCEALHRHGYIGMESEAVGIITDLIRIPQP